MSDDPYVSIVIPVYNEIESIDVLFESVHKAMTAIEHTYEVILIDDGSDDGTWPKLTDLLDKYPHFKGIRFRRNFGQTAAISAGFHASRGEVVITMDADLQNDPADIPKLLAGIDEGHDVVSGWRKDRKDTYISRRLPSMFANALISKITGVHLHDYGCTLKAYRREIVSNLHLYGEMHRFIPAMASWVGGSIKEVVVDHHARRFGTSKYGISRTYKVILDLMTVKFLLRYSQHPIRMFGKIAMLFGIPGFFMTMIMVVAHIAFNWCGVEFLAGFIELTKRPVWTIMPFMLILFCTQFITMGLLAEIQIRTYHEAQDKPTYHIRETRESRSTAD